MINIDQLDSAGNKVCMWCVVPEGNLAASDCMLARKMALETSGLLSVIQACLGPDLQGGGSGGPYPARPHDQHRSAGFRRQQGLHVVCRSGRKLSSKRLYVGTEDGAGDVRALVRDPGLLGSGFAGRRQRRPVSGTAA